MFFEAALYISNCLRWNSMSLSLLSTTVANSIGTANMIMPSMER